MDEFIDSLLREDRVCDCILPRIQKRMVLEDNNELDSRVSALDDDMDDIESSDEEGEVRVSTRIPTVYYSNKSSTLPLATLLLLTPICQLTACLSTRICFFFSKGYQKIISCTFTRANIIDTFSKLGFLL